MSDASAVPAGLGRLLARATAPPVGVHPSVGPDVATAVSPAPAAPASTGPDAVSPARPGAESARGLGAVARPAPAVFAVAAAAVPGGIPAAGRGPAPAVSLPAATLLAGAAENRSSALPRPAGTPLAPVDAVPAVRAVPTADAVPAALGTAPSPLAAAQAPPVPPSAPAGRPASSARAQAVPRSAPDGGALGPSSPHARTDRSDARTTSIDPGAAPRPAPSPTPPTTPPPVVIGQIAVHVTSPSPPVDPFAGCRALADGLTARRGGGW